MRLRTYLVTGLLVTLPLIVTFYVIQFLFNLVEGMLATPIQLLLDRSIPGLGFALTLLLVLVAGMLATNILGKRILDLVDAMITRIPLVKSVYITVKQVLDAITIQNRNAFQRVALVQYPRQGVWALGFLTGQGAAEVEQYTGKQLVTVFIPTTPNPTSGMMVMVPREEVILLEMSVEDGLKLIISGGVIAPNGQVGAGKNGTTKG